METLILFAMVLGFLFVGVPVGLSLGLSSILYVALFTTESLSSVAISLFGVGTHYTLLAIPFFILASSFMSTGGVAKRLIRFAIASVGHFRGGLAMASVLACMMFAALSGSSPATVVAIGTIAIAGMRQVGYSKEFASGIIANAGTLGILIPPSIVMVVYAASVDVSVGRMFLAGVIPGALAGLMLMVAIYIVARYKNLPAEDWKGMGELVSGGKDAFWGLFLIVIIMGGIYGGIFTPTEAAAVSAVYALFIAVFIYKDLAFKDLPKVFLESSKTTVMLMFIVANALLFAHVLTTERIPQAIAESIVQIGMEPWMFLLVVNVLLLIAGNFMEPTGIILILAPILFPIATELGIDPIHLGIIMVVNMEIGMVTPPVGLNLFVTSGVTGMNLMQVTRAALPWLAVLLVFLLMVTYIPEISLGLPNYVFGK